RNDLISKATPLANTGYLASISPLVDPPDETTLSPDTDYYQISAVDASVIQVNVNANTSAMDPVLELVDANGARLNGCRYQGDTTSNFNSPCINDDSSNGTLNSQLEYRVPGSGSQPTSIYAHVLDWRGDARPDMTYYIGVTGAFVPIVFQTNSV